MLSKQTITYFKENGYSFEQIEGVKLGLEQSEKGDIISHNDMKKFIKNELFSKYTVNV